MTQRRFKIPDGFTCLKCKTTVIPVLPLGMKFRPTKQEALEAGKQYEYKRNSTVSYDNRSSKPNKLFEKSVRELYG